MERKTKKSIGDAQGKIIQAILCASLQSHFIRWNVVLHGPLKAPRTPAETWSGPCLSRQWKPSGCYWCPLRRWSEGRCFCTPLTLYSRHSVYTSLWCSSWRLVRPAVCLRVAPNHRGGEGLVRAWNGMSDWNRRSTRTLKRGKNEVSRERERESD